MKQEVGAQDVDERSVPFPASGSSVVNLGEFVPIYATRADLDVHLTLWRTGQCFRWVGRADAPPLNDDEGQ